MNLYNPYIAIHNSMETSLGHLRLLLLFLDDGIPHRLPDIFSRGPFAHLEERLVLLGARPAAPESAETSHHLKKTTAQS